MRLFPPSARQPVYVIGSDATRREDLLRRIHYYAPDTTPVFVDRLPIGAFFSFAPVLALREAAFSTDPAWRLLRLLRRILCPVPGVLFVNSQVSPQDGWEWAVLTRYLSYISTRKLEDIKASRATFQTAVAQFRSENLPVAYVFGTGTSLEKAGERNWADGYRIVCNTIVKDRALWHRLNPHFIVAGDAIYHFGHTEFADAFRRDLIARLRESGTYFVYPAPFDAIVRSKLPDDLLARCLPIPVGPGERINVDLTEDFQLPALGNVLPLLLLPLACTLSRRVHLWGFDGRAPTDKYFWANSPKHSYPEHFQSLLASHPAFFDHHVPRTDPLRYARAVHGDILDHALSSAEAEGWEFVMMHETWTEVLAKRMRR